ncbi:cytochrome P460 family protein [Burkholderia pyrrocinia]|uniref:cytochrome P460 family protein n=1 Tax=Burkholderia pyrrocinia TaxID=60550 RepID=UPI002AAF59CD|nr:cytochrome P460 family protein [Burkholderia pyrrocinia]
MTATSRRRLARAAALIAFGIAVVAWASDISSPVQFPEDYKQGVHYATVTRSNIRGEIYTSREAVEAAKKSQPLSEGAVILMEDYRDGELYRSIAMEKKARHGTATPADIRTDDWAFQSFDPGQRINRSESVSRCMACQPPPAKSDLDFTYNRMQSIGAK